MDQTDQNASRRRVRGMGAGQIIATILLTNFNLRKIAGVHQRQSQRRRQTIDSTEQLVRRGDREFFNAYTNTYPAGGPQTR